MFKRIARTLLPRQIRHYLQKRKLERIISILQHRVVEHRYGNITLKIELADPLAASEEVLKDRFFLTVLARNENGVCTA